MKTEMTERQAITLYAVIEALCQSFDAENLRRENEGDSVAIEVDYSRPAQRYLDPPNVIYK